MAWVVKTLPPSDDTLSSIARCTELRIAAKLETMALNRINWNGRCYYKKLRCSFRRGEGDRIDTPGAPCEPLSSLSLSFLGTSLSSGFIKTSNYNLIINLSPLQVPLRDQMKIISPPFFPRSTRNIGSIYIRRSFRSIAKKKKDCDCFFHVPFSVFISFLFPVSR